MASGAAAAAAGAAAATTSASASLAGRFRKLLSSQPAPRIILGTASSSRRQIMDGLASDFNFSYQVVKADIDEKAIRHAQPRQLVTALAHAKADAIVAKLHQQQSSGPQDQRQQPSSAGAVSAADPATTSSSSSSSGSSSSYLITCDQVVVHEGVIREKPEDVAEAHRFIHSYARSPAQTVGAVVCTHLGSGARAELVEVCTIHMSDMPDAAIDALIAEGDVMWCAGGLMVEHPLVTPHITAIEGSQEAVMGLGRETVMQVLCEAAGVAADEVAA